LFLHGDQPDRRCFSFFRRPKVSFHIKLKGMLNDTYKEMEKAKSVLEKELSAAEVEIVNHLLKKAHDLLKRACH